MKYEELAHIIAAVLVLFLVISLGAILGGDVEMVAAGIVVSLVVVIVPVLVKKGIAYSLDASVEHRLWYVYQFGIKPHDHFKKEVPFGLIVPLLLSFLSLGLAKVMTILTYETRALKHRAAKRFGFYSYSEMTDWHNGLIGASGIIALLLISFISYFPGWEYLSKIAAYYAFWNMLPLGTLDGTQIFFGNRILYAVIGIITLIFVAYALIL